MIYLMIPMKYLKNGACDYMKKDSTRAEKSHVIARKISARAEIRLKYARKCKLPKQQRLATNSAWFQIRFQFPSGLKFSHVISPLDKFSHLNQKKNSNLSGKNDPELLKQRVYYLSIKCHCWSAVLRHIKLHFRQS